MRHEFAVDGEAFDGLRQVAAGVGEDFDGLQQVIGDHRQHDVQLKVPGLGGETDRGVVAYALRGRHQYRLGNHRVDLGGHDGTARLQGFQADFAEPAQGSGVHPAQIIADLDERGCQHAQLAAEFEAGVLRTQPLEQILHRHKADTGSLRKAGTDTFTEIGAGVYAGADRSTAERELLQTRERRLNAISIILDL